MCYTRPGPGCLGLVPVSTLLGRLPPARLRATPSSSWSFGPCRDQAAGLLPGAQRSLVLGTRNQGHSALTLCTGHRQHDSVRVRHSEVTVGKKARAMVPGVQWRGAPLLFLQTEECATEELCGPYLWAGNHGHKDWPRRVCFPRSHVGPTSCLPSRRWAPRLEGRGWRSRQAESSRWAPLPVAKPRVPQNSGQVEPRRSRWQWTTGLVPGLGLKRVSVEQGPSSAPAPVCTLTPWRGPRHQQPGAHAALPLLCHQLVSFPKGANVASPRPLSPAAAFPFRHLCASRSWSLKTLVGYGAAR